MVPVPAELLPAKGGFVWPITNKANVLGSNRRVTGRTGNVSAAVIATSVGWGITVGHGGETGVRIGVQIMQMSQIVNGPPAAFPDR